MRLLDKREAPDPSERPYANTDCPYCGVHLVPPPKAKKMCPMCVNIPADEGFSYASWCRNLRLGRTFMSGGPIISLVVNGQPIGDTVHRPRRGGTVEISATVGSAFPVGSLELIAATRSAGDERTLTIDARLHVTQDTWIAARAGGPGFFDAPRHRDVWGRGVMATHRPSTWRVAPSGSGTTQPSPTTC